MSRKKIPLLISVIAVLFICVVVIITYGSKHIKPVEVSYISASWSYNYADIEEIAGDSDLIALIHVNKVLSEKQKNSLPFSTFEVEVMEAIYGCEAGDKISIYMTGGYTTEKRIEIKDDPLLEKGQEFLVFTKKNEDGTYRILSGPQGRLEYKDGKLNSLQYVNDRVKQYNSSMNISIQNQDAKVFIDDLRNIKSK
jgi:hypothetical protein